MSTHQCQYTINSNQDHCSPATTLRYSQITLNINDLDSPWKGHKLTEWMQKQGLSFCYIKETRLKIKDRQSKSMEKNIPSKWAKKQVGVVI